MSYIVDYVFDIRIPRERAKAAREAVRKKLDDLPKGWKPDDTLGTIISHLFDEDGCLDTLLDPEGDDPEKDLIVQGSCLAETDPNNAEDLFLEAIGPFLNPSSVVYCQGEEGEEWRWIVKPTTDGQAFVPQPRIMVYLSPAQVNTLERIREIVTPLDPEPGTPLAEIKKLLDPS